MTTAATAQDDCSICSEPSEGGSSCGRCGYPYAGLPKVAVPPAAAPRPVPAPPTPPAAQEPQAYAQTPGPLPQAGSTTALSYGQSETTAAPLPQAGSVPVLPTNEPPAGEGVLPQAGRREKKLFEDAPPTPLPPPPTSPKNTVKRAAPREPLLPAGFEYLIKSALSITFLAGLAIAGILLVGWQMSSMSAKNAAPRLASRYLSALANTDYGSAYYMLSAQSQARCTMDDYRKMRGPGEWVWGNVKLLSTEKDAAELSYDWAAPGQQKQTVYLFAVRENDRWVISYNLNLLRAVEDAIRQSDPDLALLDSQEAVRVNPRDPMARAYLCEAANFRQLYDQARTECTAALKLASRYPSNLSEQSVEHLKTVLAGLDEGK